MANTHEIRVEGKSVKLSNLEKVYYPKIGFTKGEVIDYYINVAPVLLPHLKGRALTLKRYPNGVEAPFFYEKRCPKPRPSFVKTCQISRHHEAGEIEFCLVENLPTLIWIVNLGDLEMHTSLAKSRYPEKPTQVVFDLDPGEGAGAVDCAKAALLIRDLMKSLKLESFVKSSGSKGIQVYVPLNSAATYDETSLFAKKTAQHLEKDHPDLVVSNMKKALRVGKVLVDWSQNAEMKTTACVYSLRAKERPFVSMPLLWPEVEKCVKNRDEAGIFFEAKEALKRINEKGDLFESMLTLKQNIKKALAGFDSLAETKGDKRVRSPSIEKYVQKRDFSKTKEPGGKVNRKRSQTHQFVVQKHDASHLHYDFRIELDGVLKSWAVPKGLPFDLQEKRLAIMVEDHPIDYARFEGTIPKGNYGGGTVMVWDFGTWENLGEEPHKGLANGKLHFALKGNKLNGEWALVKMKGPRAPKGTEWLFLKHGESLSPLPSAAEDKSAISGKSMAEIAGK